MDLAASPDRFIRLTCRALGGWRFGCGGDSVVFSDGRSDSLPGLESLRDGSYGGLYALGRDAWSLLRWLPLLRKDPSMAYHGDSGSLSLRPDGYLSRQPAWARFSMGSPAPYRWPEQP